MPKQFNSKAKQIIRNKWAKPILSFLHDTLNKKLIYLGLPDTEAYDVKEWLEYLDIVYAFQCREYPKPSSPAQSREKVLALEDTLRTLERKRQLATFDVFDGYIEEVILRGYDNSPTIKEFIQQDTITVYNLDFCGQVTSPIEYRDRNGDIQEAYKFNAVDRLMNLQKSITFPNKKFIMFLTLHCSYDGKELERFTQYPPNSDIEEYMRPTLSMMKGKKAPYLVKAFVHYYLSQFFTQNYFIPEFLPTIYYRGDNNSPLLHFTIIGTQAKNASAPPVPFKKLKDLLNCTFISVNQNDEFENNTEIKLDNDKPISATLNSLHLFKSSKTYKKMWKG